MNSAKAFTPANDHAAEPLCIAAQGDQVLIVGPGGLHLTMSVDAAETTVTRLLDAIALAHGRMPSMRN